MRPACIDSSTGAVNLTDPKVKIVRDWIGGYHLEIEGANVYPRVKQVLTESEVAAEKAAASEQAAQAAAASAEKRKVLTAPKRSRTPSPRKRITAIAPANPA